MGVGEGTRPVPVAAVRRWWRAISLPWSQVRVLIAPSGSARMRRVRAPAPGRALPVPGEGPPGRGSAWCARPGARKRWPRFLPMIRPRPPSSPVPPGRQLSGRPPGQPHAHDRGLTTRRMGVHFCAPRRRGQHDPVLLRGSSSTMACGSTCKVASWLIVRPSAAGEPAHGAPPRHALRVLRRPLIWRGAHTPGPGQARDRRTGSASRARSLGRARRRAAMRPASSPL